MHCVLIIIDNFINVYNVNNGSLLGKVGPKEETQDKIVSACLHPRLNDFHCFYFTRSGEIYQYNYKDFSFVKKFNFEFDVNIKPEIVWATAKRFLCNGNENIIFYYTLHHKYNDESNKKYHIFAVNANEIKKPIKIHKMNIFDEKRISFGRNQAYLLSIDNDQIYYLPLQNQVKHDAKKKVIILKQRRHSTYNKKFTLIAASPVKDYFAFTGDDGKIVFCSLNTLDVKIVNKNVAHWHNCQIQDMCFSSSGSYLYSAGLETVIVRWDVKTLENSFLPRLGYSIKFICCDYIDKNLININFKH